MSLREAHCFVAIPFVDRRIRRIDGDRHTSDIGHRFAMTRFYQILPAVQSRIVSGDLLQLDYMEGVRA